MPRSLRERASKLAKWIASRIRALLRLADTTAAQQPPPNLGGRGDSGVALPVDGPARVESPTPEVPRAAVEAATLPVPLLPIVLGSEDDAKTSTIDEHLADSIPDELSPHDAERSEAVPRRLRNSAVSDNREGREEIEEASVESLPAQGAISSLLADVAQAVQVMPVIDAPADVRPTTSVQMLGWELEPPGPSASEMLAERANADGTSEPTREGHEFGRAREPQETALDDSDTDAGNPQKAAQLDEAAPEKSGPVEIPAESPAAAAFDRAMPEPIRTAAKYRPQLDQARQPARRKEPVSQPVPSAPSVLDAEFLITFRPGNWGFDLAALLHRPAGSPDEIAVSVAGQPARLSAVDETMLEPFALDDPAAALENGFAAEALEGRSERWIRTGRWLHVFGERSGVPGFASVPRVIIGQENVVLCLTSHAPAALRQIRATGAAEPQVVEGPGLPHGWTCWRGIRPLQPAAPADSDDLLHALNPRPDAAIAFAGGMSATRGAWIEGRPPSIRVQGTSPSSGEVAIDGVPASQEPDGRWTAPGWDHPGSHLVAYRGITRSYAIESAPDEWPWWPAHRGGVELAGALALDGRGEAIIVVADPALCLVGPRPGDVCFPARRPGRPGAFAAPLFRPIWAVTRKLRRRRVRPILIGPAEMPRAAQPRTSVVARRAWAQLIRDAERWQASEQSAEALLWQAYVAAARTVWRRSR